MSEPTVFDRMEIDLLVRANALNSDLHIRVHELANEYGVQQRFVREKLVEMHTRKLIRLSAFHDSGVVKRFEDWPDSDYFFNYASDSNYKRVRLLLAGAQLLRQVFADESMAQKPTIGFHA